MNAQFVFHTDGAHVIAWPRLARIIQQKFGHQKQGQSLGACRGIRGAGQHQMNNIGGAIMLSPGNKNLLPVDQPGTIANRFGHGAQRPHV